MVNRLKKPEFKILKVIGKGTFGKVFLAIDLHNGERVAIKRSSKWKWKMSREIEHLEACNECCNIMKMRDAFYTRTPKGFCVQNIVCEYMECSLGHFIRKSKEAREENPMHRIPPHIIKSIARQILEGINFLHKNNIAHRDLKPDNILIEKIHTDFKIKISDMGSAKTLQGDGQSMSYICSRWYRAPELLFGWNNYSVAVDIWSFGCILTELCTLQPIFNGKKPKLREEETKKCSNQRCGYDEPYQIICIMEVLGTPSKYCMEKFVVKAPKIVQQSGLEKLGQINIEPLPFYAILEPFVSERFGSISKSFSNIRPTKNFGFYSEISIVNLIEQLLQWDPENRISADKAQHHDYLNN